jgi:hypothetical protein
MKTCTGCKQRKRKTEFRYRQKHCKKCQIRLTGWGGKVKAK